MNPTDHFFSYVGQLLFAGGGGAAIAYALFKYTGKSWIEARFAERLETFKHQQAVELQRLRVQIESMLSGTLKLQELEFTVLPEAWNRLDEAFGRAQALTASYQEYAQVDDLNDAELDEVLKGASVAESQWPKLKQLSGKARSERFIELITWKRIYVARAAAYEAEAYIASKGLFLPPPLKKLFLEVLPTVRGAVLSTESSVQFKDWKLRTAAAEELRDKAAPIIKAIEAGIEQRLQSHARHQQETP